MFYAQSTIAVISGQTGKGIEGEGRGIDRGNGIEGEGRGIDRRGIYGGRWTDRGKGIGRQIEVKG